MKKRLCLLHSLVLHTGQLHIELFDTAGGTEEYISNPFYTAGQWTHLTVTMNDGGANASTVKFYKDGSLFQSSAADLSPPLDQTRTEQFIGRSTSDLKYFQGDLDDLRLYDVVLTDSEITTLFGEAATGILYQAEALNNPTGFSATGLPTGLSINPSTGAITGQTTAVGDHNITLNASNLSGTAPSKNLFLTVAPNKPLFATEALSLLSIGTNSANISAELIDSGGASTVLSAHYGTLDGGTDASAWQGDSNLSGIASLGQSAIGLNNLNASTSYFVRVKATNSAGSTWSDAFFFTTGSAPTPPALSAYPAIW